MSTTTGLVATALAYHHGAATVFSDLHLRIAPGELVALVGPNGAGKTTLLRILSGLSRPASGEVVLDARPLSSWPARERAQKVAALLEPPDATFGFTARELVLMGRYPHLGRAFESPADLAATERALTDLDLGALADRPYPALSAGERQRVALARVLAQDPEVLLLDEPTSRLDPAHVGRVLGLLQALAARGKAILVVLHDLDLAARLASRLVLFGPPVSTPSAPSRIIAEGPPAEVLTAPLVEALYGVSATRVDALAGRPALVLG